MQVARLPRAAAVRIGTAAVAKLYIHVRGSRECGDDTQLTTIQTTYSRVIVYIGAPEVRSREAVREIRESIEILSALACCDGYGLHQNIEIWTQIWNSRDVGMGRETFADEIDPLNPLISSNDHTSPQFIFKPEWPSYWTDEVHEVVKNIVLYDRQRAFSAEYQRTMETLQKFIHPSRFRRPIIIHSGLEMIAVSSQFRKVNQLIASSTEPAKSTDLGEKTWRFQMVLDEVFLSVPLAKEMSISTLYPTTFAPFQDTKQMNLRVLHFDVTSFQNESQADHEMLQRLMSSMEPPVCLGLSKQSLMTKNNQQSNSLHTERLELTGGYLCAPFFRIVCWALLRLNSLRALRIMSRGGCPLTWGWLALVLFHPESTCSITSFHAPQLTLTKQDMQCVQTVLSKSWSSAFAMLTNQSDNQLLQTKIEAPSDKATPDVTLRAHVKRHTKIRARASKVSISKPLVVLERDEIFPVVGMTNGKLSNWICVLLPGFCLGFVKRKDIITIMKEPVVHQAHHLTSLSMESADTDATLELLRLIGKPLLSLEISFSSSLSARNLSDLLQFCPNLTYLNIHALKVSDISPLFEAYTQGICVISSLRIQERMRSGWMETLTKQISNPSAKSQLHLRELRLESDNGFSRDELTKLLMALEVNRTLHFLHVSVPWSMQNEFIARFTAHRGDTLSLPLPTKLAFLSAVGHLAKRNLAVKQLERGVLELILAFASRRERMISIGR